MFNGLECEASFLRSIHSFGELLKAELYWHTLCSDKVVGVGKVFCESHDLAFVELHDFRIKAINKDNTYTSSYR